jgi:hypothetical protein
MGRRPAYAPLRVYLNNRRVGTLRARSQLREGRAHVSHRNKDTPRIV